MVRKILIIFILLSFITHPIGDYESGNVILRRITFSDLLGSLSIFFGLNFLPKAVAVSFKINRIYFASLILLLLFFLPLPVSLNPVASLVENLILLFLILISIMIFYTFKDSFLSSLIPAIINTLLLAAFVGFYDFIASMNGLPRIFEQRATGELSSGFRNAGQAGAYFMVLIAILLPLRFSKLVKELSDWQKIKLNLALLISIFFLFASGKIAGWIGFAVGAVLFAILSRKLQNIVIVSIAGIVLFFTYQNLDDIAPDLARRLEGKVRTRITEQIEDTSKDRFLEQNWGGAVKAFMDRPVTGTGIGAFYGTYDRYEIHSTYLKMIGETGILGIIGYLIFIISFLLLFKKPKNSFKDNPFNDYISKMLPFVIGCLVSWTYTYHLRKREFWLMVAVLLIAKYQAKIFDYNRLLQIKKHYELSKNI